MDTYIPNVKKYSTSINYYDLKRNFIVKNSFKTTLASNINSTKSITSNPVSEANKSTKRLKNESNKKIENVISEMIASFEPAKIKDKNLKILVLKEILQSQISLIDLSEKRCKTRNEITLNEIYDEWKILAIIAVPRRNPQILLLRGRRNFCKPIIEKTRMTDQTFIVQIT